MADAAAGFQYMACADGEKPVPGAGFHGPWLNSADSRPSKPDSFNRDNVMRRVITAAIGLLLVLGAVSGCTTASGRGDRQSGITVYGTVDSAVDVTR